MSNHTVDHAAVTMISPSLSLLPVVRTDRHHRLPNYPALPRDVTRLGLGGSRPSNDIAAHSNWDGNQCLLHYCFGHHTAVIELLMQQWIGGYKPGRLLS